MNEVIEELYKIDNQCIELYLYPEEEQVQHMQNFINIIREKGYYGDELKIEDVANNDYILIGFIKMKRRLSIPMMKESDDFLHILSNSDRTTISLCVSFSHPHLWYTVEFSEIKNLSNIIVDLVDKYNPDEYFDEYDKKISGFIGSERILEMTTVDLIENLVLGEWNELFAWGPIWKDHPFRETFKNTMLSEFQFHKVNIYSMQQIDQNFKVSIKTQLSKSLLTFEIIDELFYVTISYQPTLNLNIQKINMISNKNYPTDLPIDVIQCILDYPFITFNNILCSKPLTAENFIIANILTQYTAYNTNNNEIIYTIMNQLKDIATNDTNEQICDAANGMYNLYAMDIISKKIMLTDNCTELYQYRDIQTKCIEMLLSEFNIEDLEINKIITNVFDK